MTLFDQREINATSLGKIGSIAIGIVTNNQDPKNLGRVKVRFPWLEENNESAWARMATLMGGKDRGAFFLPDVGDEVVVAFDHGDMNSPYIIGALWNEKDKPPMTNKEGNNNNDIKMLKSRSGHELRFNDSPQKEKIEIRSKSGQAIVLDSSSGKERLKMITASGHSIILDDASGNEKVIIMDKKGNSISIDSQQNSVEISGLQKVRIKAPIIEIEASEMKIKSDGIMDIKGSLVKIN